MTEHYFSFVFGQDGDLASVPNSPPVNGTVNYDTGFPIGYELDNTNPGYLAIPRNQFNQILNDVTGAIQQVQQTGFPSWITSDANNGSPFSYAAGAQVWFNNQAWYSKVGSNTSQPGTDDTKWGLVTYNPVTFVTGDTVETYNPGLPSNGWIWVDGSTLGNASSGATFQGTVYQALFNVLWAATTNAVCPLFTSTGTPVGARGASASADWAANRRLKIPDERGRVGACSNIFPGGTDANVLNNAAAGGVNGSILAVTGGEQNHTLSVSELPSHSHVQQGATGGGGVSSFVLISNTAGGTFPSVNTNSTGGDQPHNNVQPVIIKYVRIKL